MTVAKRMNEFIQLLAFLVINRTGGRHITVDNMIVVGKVSLNTPLEYFSFSDFQITTVHMELKILHDYSL